MRFCSMAPEKIFSISPNPRKGQSSDIKSRQPEGSGCSMPGSTDLRPPVVSHALRTAAPVRSCWASAGMTGNGTISLLNRFAHVTGLAFPSLSRDRCAAQVRARARCVWSTSILAPLLKSGGALGHVGIRNQFQRAEFFRRRGLS